MEKLTQMCILHYFRILFQKFVNSLALQAVRHNFFFNQRKLISLCEKYQAKRKGNANKLVDRFLSVMIDDIPIKP